MNTSDLCKLSLCIMHCAIIIVITVFICTRFLLHFTLLFSYSTTQPQVWHKTQFSSVKQSLYSRTDKSHSSKKNTV